MGYCPSYPSCIYQAGIDIVMDAVKGDKHAVHDAIRRIYAAGLREGATNPDVQKGYADEQAARDAAEARRREEEEFKFERMCAAYGERS